MRADRPRFDVVLDYVLAFIAMFGVLVGGLVLWSLYATGIGDAIFRAVIA